jgi:hypothetical protein
MENAEGPVEGPLALKNRNREAGLVTQVRKKGRTQRRSGKRTEKNNVVKNVRRKPGPGDFYSSAVAVADLAATSAGRMIMPIKASAIKRSFI